jgi:hypothetical protein
MEEGGIQGLKDACDFAPADKFLLMANNALRERLRVTELNLKMERNANLNNMEPNTYMLHLQIEAALLKVAQLEQENNTLRGSLYVTETNLELSNHLLSNMVKDYERYE